MIFPRCTTGRPRGNGCCPRSGSAELDMQAEARMTVALTTSLVSTNATSAETSGSSHFAASGARLQAQGKECGQR